MEQQEGTENPITIITMGRCASHENYVLRFKFFCDSDFIFFALSFHFFFIWKHWLHSVCLVNFSFSFKWILKTYQSSSRFNGSGFIKNQFVDLCDRLYFWFYILWKHILWLEEPVLLSMLMVDEERLFSYSTLHAI